MYTAGEMLVNLVLMVFSALGWAYVSGKIVDIIVNANPDGIAFKNRMDDLNRYISFYELKPDVAQQLREHPDDDRVGRDAADSGNDRVRWSQRADRR